MERTSKNKSRQLLIMRHGKANWEMKVDDIERSMTAHGVLEAKNIGHWLHDQAMYPDIILSSTATRALDTSRQVADVIGVAYITQDARIYNASLAQLLVVLAEIPAKYKRPMIVGHNPGFEELLLHLAEVGESFYQDGGLMGTGTVAVVNMPEDWQRLDRQCGELVNVARGSSLSPGFSHD